jgi:hypothetical protein
MAREGKWGFLNLTGRGPHVEAIVMDALRG